MRFALASALVFCMTATSVLAHSWVDCVKYDPNNQLCLGYARGYPGRQNAKTNDIYTYLFDGSPKTQPMCNVAQQSVMNYTDQFPMATVQPGEVIYTTWEQNGHLNDANPTNIQILYYPTAGQNFADVSERNTAPVAGEMKFATSQNCYNPQDPNTACMGSWTVPKDLVPGQTYHFVWFWYFNANPAGQWYSTCFDLNVESASHVVQGGAMADLLAIGEPNLSYINGFTDQVRMEVANVTTLSENSPVGHSANSSSSMYSSSASSTVPTSSYPASIPMPTDYTTNSGAPATTAVTSVEAAMTTPSASLVTSSASKCRPRPTTAMSS
ncbi:hypothetical protein IW150_005600 [Coemansia sp. RSA 2607]|nr:hypothetical protein IW150_005600 [Coemansia sp. RSA 2607]